VRILFLAQRVPYPPNRGDKITTWRLIERMQRSHEVRVIAFAHDDDDRRAAAHLNSIGLPTLAFDHDARAAKLRSLPLLFTGRPLTLGVFGSKALQAAVDKAADWAQLAYAYSSSMGAFLEPHKSLARVMHFAELDSDKWGQYAERNSLPMSWIYAREQRTLLEFEARIARSFSENVFCTPLEQQVFESAIPGASSIVLRNGVDLQYYQPQPEKARPAEIVFTGVMDYLPNVDACTFFVREVLPRLREHRPDVHFTIVGSKPTPQVRALAREAGVEVTGFVEDTRAWLARASISVAPLRIARGIQNKVLEALAMGLPVVGTRNATQGIEGQAGRDFLVADSAQEQVAAIVGLLDDPAKARELGSRGRDFVERQYDWERVLEPLDVLLTRLAGLAQQPRS
jgi:sugar transferase (PEP-CTERM/EpsH1 system associated)